MRYSAILVLGLLVGMIGCSDASNSGSSSGKAAKKEVSQEKNAHSDKRADKATVKLTKEGFKKKVMDYDNNPQKWVYKGDKPCIIDFYADWCAPCRMTSPIMEDLAQEYSDEIIIYKVDTDKEKELARKFGIRSIPSFLFCPEEGKPVMMSGVGKSKQQTKEMFEKRINEILLQQ